MLHMMLNVVDFPTLGMPTMPALTLLPVRPRITGFAGASSFFLRTGDGWTEEHA